MRKILGRAIIFAIACILILPNMPIPTADADLTGGGEINNTTPVVDSVTITEHANEGTETNYQTSGGTPTSELNDDTNDYIEVNITVHDANGEDDMTWVNYHSLK